MATTNPSNPPGYLIQQGLSDPAANAATAAQLASINAAKNNFTTANKTSSNALNSGYSNAYQLQSPQIQQGGYAGAKLNYLLGLPGQEVPEQPVKTPGMSDAQFQQAIDQYHTLYPVAEYSHNLGQANAGDINGIISNLPGFQAQQDQGIKAIQNAASARGMLSSGNMLTELHSFGQGMLSDYYNKYLAQLSGQAAVGNAANNTVAGQNIQQGRDLSGLATDLGTNLANANLAAGQANTQGILSKLSSYNNRYIPTIDPAANPQNQPNGLVLPLTNTNKPWYGPAGTPPRFGAAGMGNPFGPTPTY